MAPSTPPTILITGCSSGIGLHCALALKERGYRVFATARRQNDVEKLIAQGLESALLDVNDSESIKAGLDKILSKTDGNLSALFNNAGYLQAGAIEDLTRDLNRAQFETNVFGAMELTRLALPIMRKQGYGRIIQNSSILGIVTIPYYGAYNASKFALEGFTNTLRQELRGTKIHVSSINPGPITSKLRDNAFEYYRETIRPLPHSFYQSVYQKLEKFYFDANRRNPAAKQPNAVFKKLIHALESPHPRAHYYIGSTAQVAAILRRILPDGLLDWVLTRERD